MAEINGGGLIAKVLKRAEQFASHHIALEPLSTRERMSNILDRVNGVDEQFVPFLALFSPEEGRAGVIVTFIAVMELIKESLLDVVQTDPLPFHLDQFPLPGTVRKGSRREVDLDSFGRMQRQVEAHVIHVVGGEVHFDGNHVQTVLQQPRIEGILE